jgi:hypothetical protein
MLTCSHWRLQRDLTHEAIPLGILYRTSGLVPATPGVERAAKFDLDCPSTTTLAAAPLGMRRLHEVGRAIRRLFGKVIDPTPRTGPGIAFHILGSISMR